MRDNNPAERALRERACRCYARRCDRYFAGILRSVAENGRARRARQHHERQDQRRRDHQRARFKHHDRFLAEHPELRLRQALDALAVQWDHHASRLAWGGAGWGRGTLVRALFEMRDRAPLVWSYDVDAVLKDWRATQACPQGAQIAISALLEQERAKLLAKPLPASGAPQIPLPSPRRLDDKTTKTRAHPLPPA